jgi:KDO2-lipid IV(A) lauroyltransferase
MVSALKNGEIVILLSDQHDRRNGILIDFFGRKAYTNATPFSLYKKLDIELYYMYFIRRIKNFKVDIFCEKLEFDREKIEKVEFLTALNEKFEKSIIKNPSQWFWVHNRWKTCDNNKKN